jgi:hypothetical protein
VSPSGIGYRSRSPRGVRANPESVKAATTVDETCGANTGALLMRSIRMELTRPPETRSASAVAAAWLASESSSAKLSKEFAVDQHDERPGLTTRPGAAVAVR